MILLSVNVQTEASRRALAAVRRLVGTYSGPACEVVAEAAADLTRSHFRELSQDRHRASQPRNYYQLAADAVEFKAVDGGAEVTIPHTGIALRYFGGTVRPSGRISLVTGKPITRLAVPFSGSEAEGKTPGEFADLFVLSSALGKSTGKAVLARKTSSGGFVALFALLAKTEHEPNETILPENAEYEETAVSAIREMIEEERVQNGL